MRSTSRTEGHSLLEAIIATAIFVIVSVALSGIWVMYGRSLAKSGEVIAANALARSVTEGLIANGWNYLKSLEGASPLPNDDYVVERVVRGRRADIAYNVTYEAVFNTTGSILDTTYFTEDLCELRVTVRWNSSVARDDASDGYNNEETFSTIVYRKGISE